MHDTLGKVSFFSIKGSIWTYFHIFFDIGHYKKGFYGNAVKDNFTVVPLSMVPDKYIMVGKQEM